MKIFDETTVSFFTPFKKRGQWIPGIRPIHKTLTEVLTTNWQPSLTAAIKAEPDKSKRDVMKLGLYGITPSALTQKGRKDEHVASHTGLMQFDIDNLNIRELSRCQIILKGIPCVLYLAVSASGRGLWGLVKINEPARHAEHYNALKKMFESLSIDIDLKPRAVNSLRYLSYDENGYFNENAVVFEGLFMEKNIRQNDKAISTRRKNRQKNLDDDLIGWFNNNCTVDEITEILENFGFTYHSHNESNYRYTRPGKDIAAGLSVDYHEEKKTLYSFSSNVPGLEYWKEEKKSGWSCSPVTALLLYGCGGKEKKHWKNAFAYIKDKM